MPVVWDVTNGEIVSGQGTSSIVWKAGAAKDVTISCRFDYNDSCPTSASAALRPHIYAVPAVPVISAASFTTILGGKLPFPVDIDENVSG